MGDVADMMLDGTLCEGCGQYIGDSVGYPLRCSTCQIDDANVKQNKSVCPVCHKLLKNAQAALNHVQDVHSHKAKTNIYRAKRRINKGDSNAIQ
jgi:hypothetical protein